MGTTSPGVGRKEQGGLPSTRSKGTGQEAHNQGSLEDNYRIESCKYGK
jgi:hypothetical protein